jgi:hypothetical protein
MFGSLTGRLVSICTSGNNQDSDIIIFEILINYFPIITANRVLVSNHPEKYRGRHYGCPGNIIGKGQKPNALNAASVALASHL